MWSSGGQKIAFASIRDGNTEIYTKNSDGAGVNRITQDSAVDRYPIWDPDDNRLAFAINRDWDSEIYPMDANGTNPRRLTNTTVFEELHVRRPL